VSQQLLPMAGQAGRVLALEVLVPNPAIRNLIREDKIHQIYSQMQVGQDKYAMQTLNQSLFSLYQRRLITQEEAMNRSLEVDELKMMMEGRTAAQQAAGASSGQGRPAGR
jgi:twitching motility protein PilT